MEKLDELRTKVTEFCQENPVQTAVIGAGVVAVGYVAYKFLWKTKNRAQRRKRSTSNPEDIIQTEGDTLKGDEESKENSRPLPPKKAMHESDSEDEPVILKQAIKPCRDQSGILDKTTLIKIFDKRSTIRGIRKLDRVFKEKRRQNFDNVAEYK